VSKAFTRESDDVPELPPLPPQPSPLPPGAKNYLTPDGASRLRDKLDRLVQARAQVAASSGDVDAKRHLQTLDQRIHHLGQSLRSAVVVRPPVAPDDRVHFGAIVIVKARDGTESRYRIVGVDETDVEQGCVSWLSPLAKALLNARLGQRVRLRLPLGEEELEIVRIAYE